MASIASMSALKALSLRPLPAEPRRMPKHIVSNIEIAQRPFLAANGRWRRPLLNRRKVAALEKAFRMAGFIWEVAPLKAPKTSVQIRPFKMHRHERPEIKAKRAKTIQKNLKDMPKMVEQQRKNAREERKKEREKGVNLLRNLPGKTVNKGYVRMISEQKRNERLTQKNARVSDAAQSASEAIASEKQEN